MPKRKVAARQIPSSQTEGQPDDGQHDQEKEKPFQPHINPEQAEAIAQFFEDNTLFYDLTHKDYKDRAKGNALLKEFGDQIRLDRK
ncbi:hypothetical protein DPMN_142884 [Dreissena polymorpha]|uniref:Uncharacterized protein n=1 Tax=Dreissena polymorpha TaxID=45954 RepID=A0A9D4GCJ4_DREPO|nr:hypothetical protein DPMN_142884 [Dreissena polymorpha]